MAVDPIELAKRAKNPEFDMADKCHDWRNYVTEGVKKNWHGIGPFGQFAVIECCEAMADQEEWD